MGILTPITGLMTIPEYGGRIQLSTMSHIDPNAGLIEALWRIF